MADTVQGLVDNVLTEGRFDATPAQALNWINRKWRLMVSEARAYRKVVSVGTTSAGVSFYPFSPIEAYSFEVAGVPYGKALRRDVYENLQGRLIWTGDGGLIVSDADDTGARGITLIPTPSEDGLAVTSFAAVMPADLTLDTDGDALLAAVLEGDFHDELVAGALGTAMKRFEGERVAEADSYDAEFLRGVDRLRLRTRRRFRGAGPTQIRLARV